VRGSHPPNAHPQPLDPLALRVVRLRHGIFGNGDVGFMFINRQGTSDGATDSYNRSYGIDANFRPLRYMVVNSYLAATDEPGVTGNRTASRVQVAWRDPVWNVSAMAKQVGDAFNPGVGFIRRRAMRQLFTTFGAHPQPRLPGIIEVNPYVDLDLISDLDWSLESRSVLAGLGLTFLDGGTLSLEYDNRFERLATTSARSNDTDGYRWQTPTQNAWQQQSATLTSITVNNPRSTISRMRLV